MSEKIKERYERMKDAMSRVDSLTDKFLRECGWMYTSSTVGSVWMWTKTMDGETYYVNASHAIRIEEHLNAELLFSDIDD